MIRIRSRTWAVALLFLIFLTSNSFSQTLSLSYKCLDPGYYTRNISVAIDINNLSGSPLPLRDLTIRYYYTKEWEIGQEFTCSAAQIASGNVIGSFASDYVELSFASVVPDIPANGSSGEIRFSIRNADSTLYYQVNDYSYNASMSDFTEWDKIAVYRANSLVWGIPYAVPTATPTSAPSATPTAVATTSPTPNPTLLPTAVPTITPGVTAIPTAVPTSTPAPTAVPTVTPAVTAVPTSVPTAPPQLPDDDFLHVSGNCIVDKNGKVIRMTGTNWFGFNTGTNMFDGIWQVDLNQSLNQIAMRGFNVLRIPLSTQILDSWRNNQYPSANINSYVNYYLNGKTSLEMLDYVIQYLKSLGMKVILDMHSIESVGDGHMKPLWYENSYTSETFFSTWEWIVDRYRGDDTVIGIDLKNEPHGVPWTGDAFAKWDASNDESNWKKAAETAATRILARNPNLLVLVEGVENFPLDGVTWTSTDPADYSYAWWGGNLRGVAALPIAIGSYQSQVVYTPHEYGPSVFVQTWFYEGFNKETLYADCWYPSWFYIVTDGIAPIYIGEWGGKLDGGDSEKWMTAFRDFIIEKNLNHTYWCYNANSGDTQGLVTADWTTWDETKYTFVKPTLWRNPQGKFVGLDHAKPLYSASTGTTVTEFYAQGNPEPSTDPMPENTPTPNFALGDVNHSGAVDIVDALLIAQFYVGKILENFDISLADVNNDGEVNIVDALLIAQLYIGKITHF